MTSPSSAVAALQALLRQLGLSDGDVNRFLGALFEEVERAGDLDQAALDRVCERFGHELDERLPAQGHWGGRLSKALAGGLALEVAGNFLTDGIKEAFRPLEPPAPPRQRRRVLYPFPYPSE